MCSRSSATTSLCNSLMKKSWKGCSASMFRRQRQPIQQTGKRMNSRIVIALIAIVFCLPVAAQRRADKVEALRVAYITKHVSMSEIERERFWPVYNEYHDKLR